MLNYLVLQIDCKTAKDYIVKNHYAHGCHNAPHPCYGLFDHGDLIGVCMFATPCSEAVRESVFGPEYRDSVIELHRLHILDITPRNAESWFISRCLRLLKREMPRIRAVISFADTTQGHVGTIYKATNFFYVGKTSPTTFFIDADGRLRHPRQCGHNITKSEADALGWKPIKRYAKNRYITFLANSKTAKKQLMKLCHYDVLGSKWCPECGAQFSKDSSYDICDKCFKERQRNESVESKR